MNIRKILNLTPWILLLSRPLLGFIAIRLCLYPEGHDKVLISRIIFLAILTDIFDGILGRLLGVSDDKLRRADTQADVVFWLSILVCTCLSFPEVVMNNIMLIALVLGLEASGYIISFRRFGKEHSLHTWISKLWNIHLTIAFMLLFADQGEMILQTSLMHGILALSEVAVILFILPAWHRDVPSFIHALWIRRGKKIRRYKLLNG